MVLKACVIGLGILGREYVTRLDDRPEVDVVGVADILEVRAREVGRPARAKAYTDYVPMLREQRPDIAVIATPDPLHRDPVLAAIEAGVPAIIQEKPMATTVADAEAMLDAAEKAGARIFVNYANRGSPLDRATHYVIQQGLLGQIVYGDSHLDDHIVVPTRLWGNRTRSWVEGSSTAHFLLSHSVDFLRWVMAPAEVTEVFAISQRKVLTYTPDLYDAFLTFDNGAKFRVKAEWIKHIDGLVEFSLDFSGAEGSLRYNKVAGFAEVEGWRANLSAKLDSRDLLKHQSALAAQGVPVGALYHHVDPLADVAERAAGEPRASLEAFNVPQDGWRVVNSFVDAVLEDTLTPSSWAHYGPLPSGIDGLRQTQVVGAIVESAEQGRVVEV
ncbi:MAG: Gfo/Idh/MocA family oxidoreductase [Anaerolineae bacterium]|nr:Gfo/Idh/MocA family oxidoreductase [Anaerolineae bacterium]